MKASVLLMIVVVLSVSTVSFASEQPKVPEDVAKSLKFYVGEWTVEGKEGDSPVTGKAVFRMPPGNHCTMGTVSLEIKGEPIHFSLVTGWDVSTGWVTEQGAVSDGAMYAIKWRRVSETVDEGELVGAANGKPSSEKDRGEKKDENTYVVTCTDRKMGDESLPDQTFIFKRVVREKK